MQNEDAPSLESRLSSELRRRRPPRHDWLGARAAIAELYGDAESALELLLALGIGEGEQVGHESTLARWRQRAWTSYRPLGEPSVAY